MHELAKFKREGASKGIAKDEAAAQKLEIRAAEAGLPWAQFDLACYHMGIYPNALKDFDPDPSSARQWFELCSSQGLSQGHIGLWELYCNGKGTQQDDRKAVEHLEKAVGLGNQIAIHNKGTWVFTGRYYEKDARQALALFEQAARLGNVDSWLFAGDAYEELARQLPNGSAKRSNQLQAIIRYKEAVDSKASNSAKAQKALDWYKYNGTAFDGPASLGQGLEEHRKWKAREFGK